MPAPPPPGIPPEGQRAAGRVSLCPAVRFASDFAWLNPLFPIIAVYRAALTPEYFDSTMLVQSALWALVVGVVGVGMFVRYEGKIARHL
jgi:ABC-type polysaccharide/polyol phosphate export permease